MRLRLAALAGAACLTSLVAPTTPATASSFAFLGIRPGTLITTAEVSRTPQPGGFCTANFVFQESGSVFDPTQQLYLGTAGHCVELGDSVQAVAVTDGNGFTNVLRIGTVVLDAESTDDFALIKLDQAINQWVSPSTAYLGGPTGVYTGAGGVSVTLVGHAGIAAGNALPRVGTLGGGFAHTNPTFTFGNTVIVQGDSGAPVSTLDGLAVGEQTNLVGSGGGGLGTPAGVNGRGVTISRMLALSGKVLAVCADGKPWPLTGCPTV